MAFSRSSIRHRGSSLEERWLDTQAESFPASFSEKVDLSRVEMDILKPWIISRVNCFLGTEDEIAGSFAVELLKQEVATKDELDPRMLQHHLTGFMEAKAGPFVAELWELLLSAQGSPGGIPPKLLEEKRVELEQKKAEHARVMHELESKDADETISSSAVISYANKRNNNRGILGKGIRRVNDLRDQKDSDYKNDSAVVARRDLSRFSSSSSTSSKVSSSSSSSSARKIDRRSARKNSSTNLQLRRWRSRSSDVRRHRRGRRLDRRRSDDTDDSSSLVDNNDDDDYRATRRRTGNKKAPSKLVTRRRDRDSTPPPERRSSRRNGSRRKKKGTSVSSNSSSSSRRSVHRRNHRRSSVDYRRCHSSSRSPLSHHRRRRRRHSSSHSSCGKSSGFQESRRNPTARGDEESNTNSQGIEQLGSKRLQELKTKLRTSSVITTTNTSSTEESSEKLQARLSDLKDRARQSLVTTTPRTAPLSTEEEQEMDFSSVAVAENRTRE